MEKTIKGATKIKLAAPKSKYVEPILQATRGGESGVAEIFRTLQLRLRDSTWTIVFKSLIIVHLMIREGAPDVTLKYLAESPKRMAISHFTDIQTQGLSIRRYYEYLIARIKAFRDSRTDHVRSGAAKVKALAVDKGLLRQTETIQDQIKALLKCDVLGSHDPENEISITAFRLLTLDLLELFKAMNEGTINVLERYFEMSRTDAERALEIYKIFGKQTDLVVKYLSLARQYEPYTKLSVPKLKHAPTTLTSSLQDYLNDPDFEINRRQYLAQQEAKKTGKPVAKSQTTSTPFNKPVAKPATTTPSAAFPAASSTAAPARGPAPDLIDFFDSIEQHRDPIQSSPQQQYGIGGAAAPQQQYQIQPQMTSYNPFMSQPQPGFAHAPLPEQQFPAAQPLQSAFTGAGFGGYGPQPTQSSAFGFAPQLASIPQNSIAEFQQQQPQLLQQMTAQQLQPQQTSTNPFRQSMMPPVATGSPQLGASSTFLNRQSTNPFAKQPPAGSFLGSPQDQQLLSQPSNGQFPPTPQSLFTSPPQSPPVMQSLQAQPTGTNPFAKPRSPAPVNPISVNITGSTNPFRQSQFVSQATGTGWQHTNQGTFAGFDVNAVDTVPVFPRPGAAS